MGPGIKGRRTVERDEYDDLAEYERLPLLFDRLENELDEEDMDEEESDEEEE